MYRTSPSSSYRNHRRLPGECRTVGIKLKYSFRFVRAIAGAFSIVELFWWLRKAVMMKPSAINYLHAIIWVQDTGCLFRLESA
jgi:hypothetical protein